MVRIALVLAMLLSFETAFSAEECVQTEGITEALNYLAMGGSGNPPPGEVCSGKTSEGTIAETDRVTGRITIDYDVIRALFPGVQDPETLGWFMAVIIYHETLHWSGNYPDNACGEIMIYRDTAAYHSSLINLICSALPGADIGELCDAYNRAADCFNNGCTGDGAEAVWNEVCGAYGSYPGDIPSNDNCDGAAQNGGKCPEF